MPLIYLFAAIGLAGFVVSMFMGVTVVGVCRYGATYRRFFERLKTLGTLETIKEMAGVYLVVLNKFLGPKVGFKQQGVLEESKYLGPYIEHLLLLYWVSATILVLSFRPVEPSTESTSSVMQAAAFIVLLTINVVSDAISLLWTKRCIALLVVPREPVRLRRLITILTQDILVAFLLMIVVQFVSNGLYAVQIGRPSSALSYMFDAYTAFKPYHAVDPAFSNIEFPGQLVITCTTYLPSLLFYFTCLLIICLLPFYNFLIWILGIFNLESARRATGCTQVGFIGSLAGVGGLAVGSGALFVGAWIFIRTA
ncbi:hypothetical protein ACVOMS_18635 [Bradyrhizobium guangxiense]